MRKYVIMMALMTMTAGPLLGQVEIGAFNKYTHFDKSYGTLRNRDVFEGVGGRLGVFFSHTWELELGASYSENDAETFFKGFSGNAAPAIRYVPVHLRLNWNKQLGSRFSWILGAGPAYNRYLSSSSALPSFKGHDWAISGMTGLRFRLNNWLALRVDGTADYIPSPNSGKTAVVTQFQGINVAVPKHNTNLGAEFGLSIMRGTRCDKMSDGTTITPTSTSTQPGGTVTFSSTSTNCGKPDEVKYTVAGPGTISSDGRYTAGAAGNATVTACGEHNKLCSAATVTVAAPPPPSDNPTPMGPRMLTRCELNPGTAAPRIDQPVSYTATLYFSDGTTALLPNAVLSAPGGSVSGNSVSWSSEGGKTVVVTCGNGAGGTPVTATATVDVQRFAIVIRDSVYFEIDQTKIYRTDDQTQLGEVAKVLIAHPDIRLIIDGHADADGSVGHNSRLAMNRALSMKKFLADHGVPVDRMTIVLRSFGECVPVAS
ncbi:MAG: OmpA family protein, partial [Gemmatimonadales bacterium]